MTCHSLARPKAAARVRRASVGMVAPEFFTLPNYPGATPNPVEAFSSVPSEGIAQIFLFMAWLELYYFNKGNWTMMTMFEDKDRRALPFGNRGLDSQRLARSRAKPRRYAWGHSPVAENPAFSHSGCRATWASTR